MIFENNFLGRSGLYWFIGTVESRMDPLKLNRVQVRCRAWDSANKAEMPTEDLPWAHVGGHSANNSGVSESSDYTEGSWVFGFFLDGIEAQQPFVVCSFAGIPLTAPNSSKGFSDPRTTFEGTPQTVQPTYNSDGSGSTFVSQQRGPYPSNLDEPDTSRMARNDSGFQPRQVQAKTASRNAGQTSVPTASGSTFSEPPVAFAAKYPYNKVRETESGHTIELDDTPGAERVHIYHRTGSFVEILPDGSIIFKAVNDSYTFAMRNSYEHVDGKQTTTIDKGYDLLINRDSSSNDYNVKIGAGGNHNITLVGGNMNLNVTGDVNETITGNVTSTIGGNVSSTISGKLTANVSGNTSLTTPKLDVTCPTSTFSGMVTVNGLLVANAGFTGTGSGPGGNAVSISGPVEITGNIQQTGDTQQTGTITASTDVIGGGTSLKTHKHRGDSGGTTSAPL